VAVKQELTVKVHRLRYWTKIPFSLWPKEHTSYTMELSGHCGALMREKWVFWHNFLSLFFLRFSPSARYQFCLPLIENRIFKGNYKHEALISFRLPNKLHSTKKGQHYTCKKLPQSYG
jgi:hypothetical protein